MCCQLNQELLHQESGQKVNLHLIPQPAKVQSQVHPCCHQYIPHYQTCFHIRGRKSYVNYFIRFFLLNSDGMILYSAGLAFTCNDHVQVDVACLGSLETTYQIAHDLGYYAAVALAVADQHGEFSQYDALHLLILQCRIYSSFAQ